MISMDCAKAHLRALYLRLQQSGLTGDGPVAIGLRADGEQFYQMLFPSPENADPVLTPITDSNSSFAPVFALKPDAKVILRAVPPHSLAASKKLSVLPASLDDMAQIVGVTARVASDLTQSALQKALKNRNACLVKDQGLLVTGRSANEAFTTATLLEKACRTHLLGEKLGGVKPVPLLSAVLMHLVYQKKYSAINLSEEAKRGESA